MRLTRGAEARIGFKPLDPSHFTGAGGIRDVVSAAQAGPLSVAVVRFDPGTRNHWHSHAGGQFLRVIEGEGWVQARGQDPIRLGLEDCVWTDAGEVHWHGAGGRGAMIHIAVNLGETRWLEPSPPPPD